MYLTQIRLVCIILADIRFCDSSCLSLTEKCAADCMSNAPPAVLGCNTADCVCNGAQLPVAITAIISCGQVSCTTGPAIATATNIVSSFCQVWSQTALPHRKDIEMWLLM